MWLGEKINEHGIGNGISIILFANIVSRLPSMANSLLQGLLTIIGANSNIGPILLEILKILVIAAVAAAIVAFVVFMSDAERRIPVQYSKRMVGRRMYGGQSTYLPIKVNMSGVMPIIFASSMVSIPATIIQFIPNLDNSNTVLNFFNNLFRPTSPLYIVLEFVLIIAFAYFYIAISFNPLEVSNNLKKNGGFIPGIRPGKPTTDYIQKILNKIVFIGGLFLGFIAVFPLVVNAIATAFSVTSLAGIAFGGTSLLIVVGVALETAREISSVLQQHSRGNQSGFLK
jgi:preprotein translocase subunit SecY